MSIETQIETQEVTQAMLDTRNWTLIAQPAVLTCRCCEPACTLIPRAGQENGQHYALCLNTGRMHVIGDNGPTLVYTPTTRGGEGGGRPSLAPGVRVDLSRDTYA